MAYALPDQDELHDLLTELITILDSEWNPIDASDMLALDSLCLDVARTRALLPLLTISSFADGLVANIATLLCKEHILASYEATNLKDEHSFQVRANKDAVSALLHQHYEDAVYTIVS